MERYVTLDKAVGETPLVCMEEWRAAHPEYAGVPLAYAGRLDPMASGKLLVLIGDECKEQKKYHGLDKTYEFEVLFGVASDSGDVLGHITECCWHNFGAYEIKRVLEGLRGPVTFPYPKFSSKTVKGKPLHTWTLEGRLSEIQIPTYTSTIHKLKLMNVKKLNRQEVFEIASEKIESIPPVTDERKAIGNDFRRPMVREAWQTFNDKGMHQEFMVAKFTCTCESGTYMRTLAEEIARRLETCGLAFSIHRTHIGKYRPLPFRLGGIWLQKF